MKKGLQYSFLCPPSIDNFFEKPYTDDFGIGIIVLVLVLHDIWSIVWGLVLMVPLNFGSGALCDSNKSTFIIDASLNQLSSAALL